MKENIESLNFDKKKYIFKALDMNKNIQKSNLFFDKSK